MSGADVHARVSERLSAYLEGDLPTEDKASIEEHLKTCIQCRTELTRFRATLGGLARLKNRAPSSFLPDIERQIRERSRGRFFGKRWRLFGRIPFEWVSLAMIVAMLVYYIVTLQGSPTDVAPLP